MISFTKTTCKEAQLLTALEMFFTLLFILNISQRFYTYFRQEHKEQEDLKKEQIAKAMEEELLDLERPSAPEPNSLHKISSSQFRGSSLTSSTSSEVPEH